MQSFDTPNLSQELYCNHACVHCLHNDTEALSQSGSVYTGMQFILHIGPRALIDLNTGISSLGTYAYIFETTLWRC